MNKKYFDPDNPINLQSFDSVIHTDNISKQWNKLVGNTSNSAIIKMNTSTNNVKPLKICTGKAQSDTGTDQVVTNNRELLYLYIDIDPYPIGGVKVEYS